MLRVCSQLLLRSKTPAPAQHLRNFVTLNTTFNPTNEHSTLRNLVRNFTEKEVEPQANDFNKREEFNKALFKQVGELGLLGVLAPEKYGGTGMDATASVIIHEELSASDPGFCLAYLAHSILFVNNLNLNGSESQKQQYLERACSGELIGGMCMSESAVGTDVLGMATNAVKTGSKWVLNGQKFWITNGAVDEKNTGDAFLVYARTGEKRTDITLFLVEKGMAGFSMGQKITNKLGMRASGTAELLFENVELGDEHIVGTVNGATLCMMRNLEIERVTLAAMSVGIARRCIQDMNNYAKARKTFGQPINKYGQIQKHISDSYAAYMAARTYLYTVSNAMSLEHSGNALDTDAVKLFSSTMGKNVADSAIQVLGGNGFIGDYVVERLWRDSKLLEIGGGTIEAHHKNMTRDLARLDMLD